MVALNPRPRSSETRVTACCKSNLDCRSRDYLLWLPSHAVPAPLTSPSVFIYSDSSTIQRIALRNAGRRRYSRTDCLAPPCPLIFAPISPAEKKMRRTSRTCSPPTIPAPRASAPNPRSPTPAISAGDRPTARSAPQEIAPANLLQSFFMLPAHHHHLSHWRSAAI